MGENLTQALLQYRNCTLDLILSMEKEDYDSLEDILNNRQAIIDNINNIPHTVEEFAKTADNLEILILQKKLDDLTKKKRGKVRTELDKLSETKNANKTYNNRFYGNSILLNKKI